MNWMKTMMIYIAGPLSGGDQFANVAAAIAAANQLLDLGFAVHCPHLSAVLHVQRQRSYEQWIEIGLRHLRRCDAVLRIAGDSPGADREVQAALMIGLPVFLTIEELLNYQQAGPCTLV